MSSNALANVLDALIELQETLSWDVSSFSHSYVRREHIPFLETRFRLFDENLITRRPAAFLEFIRILPDEFEDLYERIGSRLEHVRTHGGPISGRHLFMIYLRFVTQRMSFGAYALDVCMGKTTVSNVVKEVTEAIIFVLHNQAFPPLTRERFEDVATKTQERFDYPRAVGFMGGKHIHIKKPARSGSIFWNYKHYYSIILLAIADADYQIIMYDIGAPGRAGDAGVFRTSKIKVSCFDQKRKHVSIALVLEHRDDLFPPTTELATAGSVQYHILVDGSFGQNHLFIRPYRQREADSLDKRIFNTKLSGARRIIESTFGLLSQRFQVSMTRINLARQSSRLVVSLMILHNLIPIRQNRVAGRRRFEPAPNEYHPLQIEPQEMGPDSGTVARERLTRYYAQRHEPH